MHYKNNSLVSNSRGEESYTKRIEIDQNTKRKNSLRIDKGVNENTSYENEKSEIKEFKFSFPPVLKKSNVTTKPGINKRFRILNKETILVQLLNKNKKLS